MLTPAAALDAMSQSEVTVDVTGSNATDAREKAIAKGQTDAFAQLMTALAPEQAKSLIAAHTPDQIGRMVRGYEVLDEKIAANRYRASLRIHFDPERIRKLVGQVSGVSADGQSGSVLVLPVWRRGANLLLWEEINEWRRVWSRVALAGSGKIVLPAGDQADSIAVDATNVMGMSAQRLSAMATRYGAGDIVIAELNYDDATSDQMMQITLHHLGRVNEVATASYPIEPNQTKETVMMLAAIDSVENLKNGGGITIGEPREDSGSKIAAYTVIGSVADWVAIRKRLLAAPTVTRVEVSALSSARADMVVYYRGDAEHFVRGLVSQGLRMTRVDNQFEITTE